MKTHVRQWGIVAGFLVVLGLPTSGLAATAERGVAVSPAYQSLNISESQASRQVGVKITNYTGAEQNFRLSTTDFGSLDEEGGVAFLGRPANELEHRYGLASWLSLEKDTLVLPNGASAQVLVTVSNRESLSPGGHYGAVLATLLDPSGQPALSQVGVKQVLSSLILVSKDGGGIPDLRLVSEVTDGGWSTFITRVTQRFQNAGNMHLAPRGVSEVRDPVGQLVARGAINPDSALILPESFRRYRTSLTQLRTAWMPGRYTVKTTYRYDGTEQTRTHITSFWYAGLIAVWGVMLLALAAVGWLGWWLWRRRS
jgi:hypothetical protein